MSSTPTLPKKRIVVFADGTGLGGAQTTDPANYSNILRLSRCVRYAGIGPDGKPIAQVVFYQSGLGSEGNISGVTDSALFHDDKKN